MGKLLKMLVIFVVITFLIYPEVMAIEQKKTHSVNDKILEILIKKNIITKEKYEELRQLAQEEENAKKPKVVAGFNKGFYPETADKQSKIKFDGRFQEVF